MDLIEPILAIAEKLYSLCEEVKANKKRCARLAQRVSALAELVRAVKAKVRDSGGKPELSLQKGLQELKLTLESAQEVVQKYTSTSYLKRIVKAHDFGEEFGSLNERLNDAAQLLSLALQVEEREMVEDVFKQATRRKQDEEDRENDRQELQKLLQTLAETKEGVDAVHKTVDNTQREVQDMKVEVQDVKVGMQDIKVMLESLKRPSIHLQDIREIRPEELNYDIPIVPIMTTDNSEVFKGEYNKFTVVIKRYTMNTSPSQVRSVFRKEVDTMKRFDSPNILRMFGICVENEKGPSPNYLIVMEFCEKGSLREVLDKPKWKLSWDRKARMCLDAAQGVYRLHQSEEKFKVHGCISSSKFLVDAGYRVKLGGFELAKTETSLRKGRSKNSSLHYSSPQQLQNINHLYDKACEIYSFGIVLWEIATRQHPFKDIDLILSADCTRYREIHRKVCEEKVMEPLPGDCPGHLGGLINACRSYDAFQRPSAGVLVDELRKAVGQFEED